MENLLFLSVELLACVCQYLESIEAEWSEVARREGVWVVGSCAFDSIPNDLGLVNFKKEFPGQSPNYSWRPYFFLPLEVLEGKSVVVI